MQDELQKTNMCCLFLIKLCADANATGTVITQENVTHEGVSLGDWEITVKKK